MEENHKLAHLMHDIVNQTERKFVLIGCNNDDGFQPIREAALSLQERENVRYFPNLRFENYLTLLENAELAIGNSSSFVREAPIFGIPSIIPGTRQQDRTSAPSVFYVDVEFREVADMVADVPPISQPTQFFGDKNSASNIHHTLMRIFEMPPSQPKRFQNVEK
jgi:UDP-N-acetylglucosamine 2-epimerase (hydrolysing)